jgi:hypothetical protein
MKKIYIAGPMRGHKHYNFSAFDDAEQYLKAQGYFPISPAQLDRMYEGWYPAPPEDIDFTPGDYRRMIRRDLNAILDDCEAIYLLKGWENSKGAQLEKALAVFLGLEILYE